VPDPPVPAPSVRPSLPPLSAACEVSVIVPARDAADTVTAALRSALAQHPPVTEVLVGTDPGDDATRRAVVLAADGDARVRLVDVPGGRTPDALQTLVEAATGEVVVRLDAHAVLPDGYVARAVATLRRTGAGNVGGRQVPTATEGFAAAVAATSRGRWTPSTWGCSVPPRWRPSAASTGG
jgi:succinoglycan biosynthesis protein ExoA